MSFQKQWVKHGKHTLFHVSNIDGVGIHLPNQTMAWPRSIQTARIHDIPEKFSGHTVLAHYLDTKEIFLR